ncbi:DUF5325 family protein [Bacillus sp. FSL K6-3431]|uniref:DUF5325 family protein n=1 Tax=Bacillus sp. FSL K6-3431 TaxID=2921500 RepID=UPI0030F9061D
MNNIKWNLLLLATLATFSIIGIGFSIGAKSIASASISILCLIGIMGYGFITKKKMRDEGKL